MARTRRCRASIPAARHRRSPRRTVTRRRARHRRAPARASRVGLRFARMTPAVSVAESGAGAREARRSNTCIASPTLDGRTLTCSESTPERNARSHADQTARVSRSSTFVPSAALARDSLRSAFCSRFPATRAMTDHASLPSTALAAGGKDTSAARARVRRRAQPGPDPTPAPRERHVSTSVTSERGSGAFFSVASR